MPGDPAGARDKFIELLPDVKRVRFVTGHSGPAAAASPGAQEQVNAPSVRQL